MEGKKFFLGKDVIISGGKEAIKEFKDSNDEINTIYIDRDSLAKKERETESVLEFMRFAQMGEITNEGYLVDNVQIVLHKPDKPEETIAVTYNPFEHESFREMHVKEIQKPLFLCQDPNILNYGLVERRMSSPSKLPKIISLLDDLEKPFINQFVHIRGKRKGTKSAIYKVNVKKVPVGNGKLRTLGEPFLERVLLFDESQKEISSQLGFQPSKYFNIGPQDLRQYLALEQLLMDPKINMVLIHGEAGTGKSLIPYVAALAQTMYRKHREDWISPLYKRIILTKANDAVGGRELGFRKGGDMAKLAPVIESFRQNHEDCDEFECPFGFQDLFSAIPFPGNYEDPEKIKKRIKHHENRLNDSKVADSKKRGIEKKLKEAKAKLNKDVGFSEKGDYGIQYDEPVIIPKHTGDLRGQTLSNCIYFVDEGQNFSRREMKDFISRVGRGAKIIIMGDVVSQINNVRNTPEVNGMVWAAHGHIAQKHPYLGLMNFTDSHRGPLVEYNNRIFAPRD